jgi:hypothetical protein
MVTVSRTRQVVSRVGKFIIPLMGGMIGALPSSAQPVLEQAKIYKLINTALINDTQAELEDTLLPQDLLETQSNSRADLLFNEGTIARATANTRFRFEPGLRRFQLTDGTELFVIRPGNGGTIETPTAQINVPGTALFVQHEPDANRTRVGVLTNHPTGGVQVSNAQGEDTVELNGGEIITVTDGVVGAVQTFDLSVFYETSQLTAGLGPGCEGQSPEGPSAAQATLNAVCPETLAALRQQQANIPSEVPATEEPNDNIRGISPGIVGPNQEDFPVRIDVPEPEQIQPEQPVEPQ